MTKEHYDRIQKAIDKCHKEMRQLVFDRVFL